MANRGLYNSGAAQQKYADLAGQLASSEQQIANQAESGALSLQTQVAQQKQTLINQLLASTYPTTVANQALTTASQFSSPSVWEPLAQQFTSDTNAASNVVENESNATFYQQLYPNSGSV